jgi:hypothetical protein
MEQGMSTPQLALLFVHPVIVGVKVIVLGQRLLVLLERAPDATNVAALERPYPLPILNDTDCRHQDGGYQNQETIVDDDVPVEQVSGSKHLNHQSHQVAMPQLVVLESICRDVVRAAKVQQEEGCSERHELVPLCRGAKVEVAQLVRKPEDELGHHGSFSPSNSSKQEEDELQSQAQQNQQLARPIVPKV